MEDMSTTANAIVAFSQSEKIKAALIWLSSASGMIDNLPGPEKQGAERFFKTMVGMVHQEVMMAKRVTGYEEWDRVSGYMERAMVMIESGVASQSVDHLTMALSQVTNIGQKAMSYLKEKKLLGGN